MSKIISIANQKGGVGKTTTTVNMAAGLAHYGCSVLCIDFDPQANMSDYLGYEDDGLATISELMQAATQQQTLDVAPLIRHNDEGIDYIPSNIILSSADVFLATAMCREQVLRRVLQVPELQAYDYILIDCLPSLGILLIVADAIRKYQSMKEAGETQ